MNSKPRDCLLYCIALGIIVVFDLSDLLHAGFQAAERQTERTCRAIGPNKLAKTLQESITVELHK